MNQTNHAVLYLSDQINGLKSEISDHPQKKLKKKRVHNLRIILHKIRSLLEMTSIENPSLKKLDKSLGKVRDLDVAIKNARSYGLPLKKLKKKRKKSSKKAKVALKSNSKKTIGQLKKDMQVFEKKLDLKSAVGTLKSSLRRFNHELQDDELHKVRISLKKVRYLLESTGRSVVRLKKIQDQLGEVHDLEVLSEYYKKNPHLQNDRRIKSLTAKKTIKPLFKHATTQLNDLVH